MRLQLNNEKKRLSFILFLNLKAINQNSIFQIWRLSLDQSCLHLLNIYTILSNILFSQDDGRIITVLLSILINGKYWINLKVSPVLKSFSFGQYPFLKFS